MRKIIFLFYFCLILSGCTSSDGNNWSESDRFYSEEFELIGIEGKIGLLGMDFIASKENKYMWHFWGSVEQLSGSLRVTGTKENTNEEREVFSATKLGGPNNGADAHLPSSLMLPEPGMWRLDAYINNQLFESIYVNVKSN